MATLYYSKDHEYVRVSGDSAIIGISVYAQEQLGDVVFVELPVKGTKITKGAEIAVVESVKAASEVYAPVDGEVIEINQVLEGSPGLVNESPLDEGWFAKVKLSDPKQLDDLMDEAAYKDYLTTLS